MYKKIISCIIFLVASHSLLFGQIESNYDYGSRPAISGPNVATLGKFGNIPVSLFNGEPIIEIPIAQINNGEINVPIKLSYDASGCRPDQHPSWVGLNWALNAGGVIRREKNGYMDEAKCYGNHACDGNEGYIDYYSDLAVSNWNTVDFLKTYGRDASPDEFTFTVNDISGSFMLNHEGKWVVRTKDNIHIKVEAFSQEEYPLYEGLNMPRTFTKFILTTDDGTKYIFGEQPNAIEFSQGSIPTMIAPWNLPDNYTGPPIYANPYWRYDIVSSSWYLTKIISPMGGSTDFIYSYDYTLQQNSYTEFSETPSAGSIENPPYGVRDGNQTIKFKIKTSYLKEIITDNNVVCTFIKSPSNELVAEYKTNPNTQDGIYYGEGFMNYHKLDFVEIKIHNKVVKRVALEYIEKPTERLKLSRVKFLSLSSEDIKSEYILEYNDELLPDYNTGELDHWGFYNGKKISVIPRGVDTEAYEEYYESREPDADLMGAEILKRITYPTGGYTDFFFEPHDYSKVMIYGGSNINIEQLNTPKIAGGLRIKRIENYANLLAQPLVQEYFYKTNYINGGNVPSGVLSGRPIYYEEGTLNGWGGKYFKFSSNPLNYLNTTNGNHVTYSEVTEKKGEGYTVYRYTNHDNGYSDRPPFVQINNYTSATNFEKKLFGRLDLERGLLEKKQIYTEGKHLIKEITNQYNSNPNRYNQYIRAKETIGNKSSLVRNSIAFPIYIFHPYLEKEIIKEYVDGTSISEVTTYTYDSEYRQLKSVSKLNSQGNTINVNFKYPTDYVVNSTASLGNEIHDLVALSINNVIKNPIEITRSIAKNGNQYITGSRMFLYENLKLSKIYDFESDIRIPPSDFIGTSSSQISGFIYDSRYKEALYIPTYDSRGNILEYRSKEEPVTSYVWAYNKTYPVAKVINASTSDIKSILGSSVYNNLSLSFDPTLINNSTKKLRDQLMDAQVLSYDYYPFIGMKSETSANNVKTSYNYDDFGRLTNAKDREGYFLSEYRYNLDKFKRLSVVPERIDFANVAIGSTNTKDITIINVGNLPVSVNSISSSSAITCNFTLGVINPGQSTTFQLIYTPNGLGNKTETINVNSDAESINSVSITANVSGTRIINLSGDLTFNVTGSMMNFPTTYRTMTITNSGTELLTISDISVPHGFSRNWTNGSIAPGQSKNVSIGFVPINPGTYSGEIMVHSNRTSGGDTKNVTGTAIMN